MIRRRLFLHLSEAQSTGLVRRRPPPEIAVRWSLITTVRFVSDFIVVFTGKPKNIFTQV